MTWEGTDALRLESALGFWELGMAQSALDELAELSATAQYHPEVMHIRLTVLMDEHRWLEALSEAETLCRLQPAESDGWIKVAFCLHELKRTREAKERLLSGPPALRETAIFYYNLSCYECLLGHLQEAWLLLERAIQIDPSFKKLAESDADLEALRSNLGD